MNEQAHEARRLLPGADIRRFTLRFAAPSLENEFQKHRLSNSLQLIRLWGLAGIALYALFGIVEYFFVREILETVFIIRYAVVLPILIVTFVLTYLENYLKMLNRSFLIAVSLPSIGSLVAISLSGDLNSLIYFAFLLIMMLFTHAFTGVRFWLSTLVSWMIFFGCLAVILAADPYPAEIAALCLTVLFFATVIAMFMSYNEEIYIRRHFRNSRLLIQQTRNAENLAAQATEASLSKSNFLAMMSHELRTPLNAIIGFAEIISTELFGKVEPERYRQYGTDIGQSGRHLLDIINDVLDISKAEAGMLSPDDSEVALGPIVQSCFSMFEERAHRENIGLSHEISEEIVAIQADERMVKQIILNLLSNSIKFTPAGGKIALDARRDGDGGLLLTISDTGIGMLENETETVFEPFTQAESSLSRRYEGTGLGLPLVRRMAELHGGTVTLQSKQGKGTIVTVRFPPERVLPRSRTATE